MFAYSSKREQSNERSETTLKTESETGERRLRHALPISLLILRKKSDCFAVYQRSVSMSGFQCMLQAVWLIWNCSKRCFRGPVVVSNVLGVFSSHPKLLFCCPDGFDRKF